MANEVLLQEGHPLDENLRPLKIGGDVSSIEIAQHGDGAKINGDLLITDNVNNLSTNGNVSMMNGELKMGEIFPTSYQSVLKLYSQAGLDPADYCSIGVAAHGVTVISTVDGAGTGANLNFAVDGYVNIVAELQLILSAGNGLFIVFDAN